VVLPLSEGDAGTVETVAQMCRLVDAGSKDPQINALALQILQAARVPEFNFEGERRAIYSWFRKSIRFVRDIDGKETLRSARETLARGMGDCDCQTIAMLALLKTIGQRVRIVTVATAPQAPDRFSHVFPEVRNERGQWVPMDAARRKPRYGLGPRSWFRRYGWDTDTCQAVNLDDPQAAAQFTDDDGTGALAGLGIATSPARGWGFPGMSGPAGVRATMLYAGRAAGGRVRLSRLRGLRGLGQDDGGFDVSQLETEIPSILTGTAQVVSAARANPINLGPVSATTGLTPAATALLATSSNPLASLSTIPGWVWLAGGAVILIALMGRR
jgi:hypothetical protein